MANINYKDLPSLLARKNAEVQFIKIKDIATFRRGSFPQPYGYEEWYDGEGAMLFIQVADVDNNLRLVPDTKRKISRLAQPKSLFIPKGTVIVTLQGTLGRVAITDYDAYIDRTLAVFTDFKIEIDKTYFAYALRHKFSLEKLKARGTIIKTITKEEFSDFELPIPSLEVQKEIVVILEEAEQAFEQITNSTPAFIKAIKDSWQFTKEQLFNFDVEQVELVQLNNPQYIKIANNKRKAIKATLRIPGTIPYHGANCIQSYIDGFTHEGDYVLIAEDGTRDIDDYSIQWASGKFWANNHVHVIQGTELVNNRYLYFCCKNTNFRPFLTAIQRPKLTKGNLEKVVIPIPSLAKQECLLETLEETYVHKNLLLEKITTLAQDAELAYKSILSKFFASSNDELVLV